MTRRRMIATVLWMAALSVSAGAVSCDSAPRRSPEVHPVPAVLPKVTEPRAKPVVVDDAELYRVLETEGTTLFDSKKAVPMKDLVDQLGRKQCSLTLAEPAVPSASAVDVYTRCKAGVVVIGGLYKCEKCGHNHCVLASGFFLAESGAVVTNYHVVNSPKNLTLVAATADGKVYPVKSVLAASQASDLAIIQIDGSGFTPLPVLANVPVGADVLVLSHPDGRFFTLTRGIVSRYGRAMGDRRGPPVLQITADYARGSSGAPVLDLSGEVVGVVSSTQSIYYNNDHTKQEDLQMVVNQCVPAEEILKLVKKP
jgi:serine protease Do